jgi:hypothetical protein
MWVFCSFPLLSASIPKTVRNDLHSYTYKCRVDGRQQRPQTRDQMTAERDLGQKRRFFTALELANLWTLSPIALWNGSGRGG